MPNLFSNDHPGSFSDIIRNLSLTLNACLIVEGDPIQNKLTNEDAERFKNLQNNSSLDKLGRLKVVADLFDFESEQVGPVFIFRKRYSNIDDLPQLTFSEALTAIGSLLQLTKPFYYSGTFNQIEIENRNAMKELWATQSEELKKSISVSSDNRITFDPTHGGFAIAQLPQKTRRIVWNYVSCLYINSSIENVTLWRNLMKATIEQDTKFQWIDIANLHFFGFLLPAYRGNLFHYPLTENIFVKASGNLNWYGDLNTSMSRNEEKRHPNINTESEVIDSKNLLPESTIQSVMEECQRSAKQNTVKYVVHSDIKSKPLQIYGGEYVSVKDIVRAIVRLHGFRLLYDKQKNVTTITNISKSVARSPTDLQMMITKSLPKSFVAYLLAQVRQAINTQSPNDAKISIEDKQVDFFQWSTDQLDTVVKVMRSIIKAKLKNIIEPMVEKSESKSISISSVGEPQKRLLAILYLTECIIEMKGLLVTPPGYIRNFDNGTVNVYFSLNHDGSEHFSFVVSCPENDEPNSTFSVAGRL